MKAYLTGAPRLWAGLSSTVTVLSVWFREVSWSYAGMEGAEEKTKMRGAFTTLPALGNLESCNLAANGQKASCFHFYAKHLLPFAFTAT